MLRALIVLSLVLAVTACGGRQQQTATPPATEHKGLIITVTDTLLNMGGTDTIRFGRLRSGEIAVQRFLMANNSPRPVVILAADRTCGCTSLEFDPQPIMPGKEREFALTFDSRGESGWQLKVINIRFAGGQNPLRLLVEAEVE